MKKFISITIAVFITNFSIAQDNISEARLLPEGTIVIVSGVVTNGVELGSIRYIQDETAGIALYPGSNWSPWSEPVLGDLVTVTGELKLYNGLLEIDPITNFTIESSGNSLPDPEIITPNQLNEDVEGELVTIENAIFADAGQTFTSTTWEFSSGGETGVIYLGSENPNIGELIPAGEVTLTGIGSQYTFFIPATDGYQLLPRTLDDIVTLSPINFVTPVSQDNISTSGFDLMWQTDNPGSSIIKWGFSPDALDFVIEDASTVTDHFVSINGLDPATIIYAAACTVFGNDTITSNTGAYATESLSSGIMNVYFNSIVDLSVATEQEAQWTTEIHDTIIKYINMAQVSVDMAVYSNNNLNIISALNNAHDNGIRVRVVTEGSNTNTSLSSLDPDINLVERLDGNGSGMHNKFFIVDPESVDNSYVIMGSMNMTNQDMFADYNNIIVIQDQTLARSYTIEFNEMWGSDEETPNLSNSKFGEDKMNNTPHNFIIGGRMVESYFSPSDGTTSAIDNSILSADGSFDFALFVFTNNQLRDAVLEINELFFVQPRGIIDNTSTIGSDYDALLAEGVEVYSHEGIDGLLHHKYAIVDHSEINSDPQVITGSHNWSASAESVNDENTLIIHDSNIANQYYQEFIQRFNEVLVGVDELELPFFTAYPNPSAEQLNIDGIDANELVFKIFDLNGRIIQRGTIDGFENPVINISKLAVGNYLLKLEISPEEQLRPLLFQKSQY